MISTQGWPAYPRSQREQGSIMTTSRRLGPLDVLLLSAWCGLAGGWLEVGVRVPRSVLPNHRAQALR
jgi:hypothetical protein